MLTIMPFPRIHKRCRLTIRCSDRWRAVAVAKSPLAAPVVKRGSLGLYAHPMKTSLLILLSVLILVVSTTKVAAHCDTLDGPVVAAAKLALQKGDVTPVLKWVNKDSENEVREAFALAIKVRSHGEDARKLAELHFFETLVRIHRAGEGEPFTGLKPPGTIDPAFQAADKALAEGAIDELAAETAESVRDGIRKRFAEVIEKKKHADDSVEAGRAYVRAYIEYAHFIEAIHTIASANTQDHHHLHP